MTHLIQSQITVEIKSHSLEILSLIHNPQLVSLNPKSLTYFSTLQISKQFLYLLNPNPLRESQISQAILSQLILKTCKYATVVTTGTANKNNLIFKIVESPP